MQATRGDESRMGRVPQHLSPCHEEPIPTLLSLLTVRDIVQVSLRNALSCGFADQANAVRGDVFDVSSSCLILSPNHNCEGANLLTIGLLG